MSLLQSVSQLFCGCPRRCPRRWPVLCGGVPSPTGLGRGSFRSWVQRAVSLLCPRQLQDLQTADSQADSPSAPPPLHGRHRHLRFRPQGLPFPTGWRLGRVVPTVGNKIPPQREMPQPSLVSFLLQSSHVACWLSLLFPGENRCGFVMVSKKKVKVAQWKQSAYQCRGRVFNPWVGEDPQRRK